MASIPGIKGVSYAPYRGGFKLRWRELHETPEGVVRKGRSYTVAKELEVAPVDSPPSGRTFWLAYRAALGHHGIELSMGSPTFRHFPCWVAAKRGDPLHTGGWQHFLALEHSDEEGFGAFFAELDGTVPASWSKSPGPT